MKLPRRSVVGALILLGAFVAQRPVRAQSSGQAPPLPKLVQDLLRVRRGQPSTSGAQRGLPQPVGLPVYTAWDTAQFEIVWVDLPGDQALAHGEVNLNGKSQGSGTGRITLDLPHPGVHSWKLELSSGTTFAGRVRRLAEAEITAVIAALDRAQAEIRDDPALLAAHQLDIYAQHELYMTAYRYLDRRPELHDQPPFDIWLSELIHQLTTGPEPN